MVALKRTTRALALAGLVACGGGGGGGEDEPPSSPDAGGTSGPTDLPARFSVEKLMDPSTCKSCHPKHYDEWAGSMHAYAAVDPIFVAMNKRGQRETKGALGSFCVQCHAPMAVREGLTKDGLNLDALPAWSKGVTCYFCHNATDVGNDHFNANLTLARDDVMRGGFTAVDPGVHGVARSAGHDRDLMASSVMCGTCHDVVNDNGVHIERTLKEYTEAAASIDRSGKEGGLSCQACHMPATSTDFVAVNSKLPLKKRPLHEHRWPAVDVALTDDFPGQDAQREATECELASATRVLRVTTDRGPGQITVELETDAGHRMPSGTAQDRRLWIELTAYDAQGNVLLESGKIADGAVEEVPAGQPGHDPQLCMFRDHLYDAQDQEVHMFWEAGKDAQSKLLPPLTDRNAPHSLACNYRIASGRQPARIVLKMRMRPVGVDVLRDLVASGDLAQEVIAKMPTFDLRNTIGTWTAATGEFVQDETQTSWVREHCVF